MTNHEEHKRKLLVEISRLKDDLKLLEQEEPLSGHAQRVAEVQSRLRSLISRLERWSQ